jgi:hypothetical protein
MLSVRLRLFATIGLTVLAGIAAEHPSAASIGGWLLGFGLLMDMERRWGVWAHPELVHHPHTPGETLGPKRAVIAVVTLLLFVALFMPTPISV